MAPIGCHNSVGMMRACKDGMAAHAPSVASVSDNTFSAITKGLGKRIANLSRRQYPFIPYQSAGSSNNPNSDDNKPISNLIILVPILLSIAFAVLLFCLRVRPKERKRTEEERKEAHIPASKHDWEYRNQDRLNKGLRWKTLKKWCGLGAGGEEVVQEVEVAPGEKVGRGRKKEGEDVEALKGVTISPMDEWSTTSDTSHTAAGR